MIRYICDKCGEETTEKNIILKSYLNPYNGDNKHADLCRDCERKLSLEMRKTIYHFIEGNKEDLKND